MEEAEANRDIIVNLHHRLWAEADLGVIDEVFDADAVTHWVGFDANTIDAVRSDVKRYFTGFSDVTTEAQDVIAESDKVVLRWSTKGQHTGPYGRVAPTGRRIEMTGIDIYRLAGGKVVETWSMWDGLSVYEQLGLEVPEL